jgi:hypothetical protein
VLPRDARARDEVQRVAAVGRRGGDPAGPVEEQEQRRRVDVLQELHVDRHLAQPHLQRQVVDLAQEWAKLGRRRAHLQRP